MCPNCSTGKGTRHCDDGIFSCGSRIVQGELETSKRCRYLRIKREREWAWEREHDRKKGIET